MKRFIFILFASLIISNNNLSAQEGRMGYKIKTNLGYDFSTEGLIQFRSLQENSDRTRALVGEAELNYVRYKYFKPGISVRYSNLRETDIESVEEVQDKYRFAADLKIKIPEDIKHFTLQNRLRYQYSMMPEDKVKQLFRNEITASYKPSKTLKTYVGQETIYRLDKNKLDALRFEVGIDLKLNGNYGIGGYYIIETLLKNGLRTHYIAGVEVVYKF